MYARLKANFRQLLLLWLVLVWQSGALAQVVTTQPAFPTESREVTLIFDLAQAKDSRAAGLLGKTDDVYLWSGAGTTETGDAFEYQPAGQTTWSAPFAPGKMTSLGNNKWQIKLVPKQYFGVPAGKSVRRLGVLLKNGSGTAQTEDLFVIIYPENLQVAFRAPAQTSFFADANASIPVKAVTSQPATLSLKLNGSTVHTVQNATELDFTLGAGSDGGVRKTVSIEAKTATETVTESFTFTVKPEPVVRSLPSGIVDGVNYTAANKVVLSLYAPHKEFVYVIGEFNNWEAQPGYLMHRTADGERYWIELENMAAGQEVAYQYLVDGTLAVADPYAELILDPNNDQYIPATTYPDLKPYPSGASGIVSVLKTNQQPYNWKVTDFQRPAPEKLVVYELHIRDFIADRNYKTLTDTLSYLKRLGINAIELMPIMEFSGNDSWGYNPIFYFAPDKAYGRKDDLKAFIDKCHALGIAVILDIVLNQADYEFPYVKMYWNRDRPAANNPFFNQQATHPFSVFFDFNHESAATKALVERVNRFWLEEYKVDGYRFDLSKGFTQKNAGDNVDNWSAYDASRVATWKRIYNEIRSYDETAYVILEHFAVNQEEKELADYGMLFWGNHNYDYRNVAKGNTANPNWISYRQREWQNPHVVGYMESHDEERLLYDVLQNGRVEAAYNTQNLTTALNRAKLAAAFFLPVPGPKLIWQFGELGYEVPIDFNGRTGAKPVRWEYQQDAERQKLYKVYAALINLKLSQPAFQTDDFTLDFENSVKRITLRHETMDVHIIGNFDTKLQKPAADFPKSGIWYDYFSGGEVTVTNPAEIISLQPGEFRLFTTRKLETPAQGLLPWQGLLLAAKGTVASSGNTLVYPNPVQGGAVVEMQGTYRGAVAIKLLDATGRVIRTEYTFKLADTFQQPINLSNVTNGIYYLQIEKGAEREVKKVIKVDN
ncbi:alpha-amylase [Pontibacter sp. SGAir0037]|nr:alpha-amylase [Pontibacter sp. SGAir0037]